MKPRIRILSRLGILALAFALSTAVVSALPSSATVQFGRVEQGSGCVFPCEDDQSFHALDRIVPKSVAIAAGGTVTFDVEGFHQVAIYESGATAKDIEPDPAAVPFVNDADGRTFLGGFDDVSYTFTDAGKYLVICNVAPHFEESQMWGWVVVK